MNFWTYPGSEWEYLPPPPNEDHFAEWRFFDPKFVLGISSDASAEAAFSLSIDLVERTEVHDVGLLFDSTADAVFSLTVSRVTFNGNVQSFALLASASRSNANRLQWNLPVGGRIPIISGLSPIGATRIFSTLRLFADGSMTIRFVSSQIETSTFPDDDLSDEFELNGSITVEVGDLTLNISLRGVDLSEPYNITPSNSADVSAMVAANASRPDGSVNGRLTLRDFDPFLIATDIRLESDAIADADFSLAVDHIEETEVLDLRFTFDSTANADFLLAVSHVESVEVLDIGLFFDTTANADFSLAVSHAELGEIYDVGLSFDSTADATFALAFDHLQIHRLGLIFQAQSQGQWSLSLQHVEDTEIHDLPMEFDARAQSDWALALGLTEATDVHTLGLVPATAQGRGTWALQLNVIEAPPIVFVPDGGFLQLPSEWMEGGGSGYLRRVTIDKDGMISVHLSDTETGDPAIAGPLLTAEVRADVVITLSTLILNGIPTDTEPYSWTLAEAAVFFSQYIASGRPGNIALDMRVPERVALDGDYEFIAPRPVNEIPTIYDEEGAVVAIGIMDKETFPALVARIRPQDDLSARVSLIPLSNEIHAAETGVIPPYNPYLTGLEEITDTVVTRPIEARELIDFIYDPSTGEVTLVFSDGTTDDFTINIPGLTIDSITTLPNGNIQIVFSDGSILTIPSGQAGRGIMSVVRDPDSGIVTITYDDGTTQTFIISDGADGPGFEIVFIRTPGLTPPANIQTTADQREMDQFLPDAPAGITRNPMGPEPTLMVEWGAVRTGSSGNWGEFSAWALFSRFGLDGTAFEWIYRVTNTGVKPARPATTDEQDATDDFVPMGWIDDEADLNPGQFQWFSRRTRKPTGGWNKFGPVKFFNRFGLDGTAFEWIFRVTNGPKPAQPTTTDAQDAIDDFVPADWNDDEVDLTAGQVQWFSRRTRRVGGGWNKFGPVKFFNRFALDGLTGVGGGRSTFLRIGEEDVPNQLFTFQWIRGAVLEATVSLLLSLTNNNLISGAWGTPNPGGGAIALTADPMMPASPREFTATYAGVAISVHASFIGTIADPDIQRQKNFYAIPVNLVQQLALEEAGREELPEDLVNLANAATPGDNVLGDFVSFYRDSFAHARTWDGTSWVFAEPFLAAVNANFVNVNAIFGDFNDLIVSGTLSATYLSGDIFNVDRFILTSATPFRKVFIEHSVGGTDLAGVALDLRNYDYLLIDTIRGTRIQGVLVPVVESSNGSAYGSSYLQGQERTSRSDPIFLEVYVENGTTFHARRRVDYNAGIELLTIIRILGVRAPGVSLPPGMYTQSDQIYIEASSTPATPTGGTDSFNHLPSGWTREEPDPTSAGIIYSSTRILTFNNGVFDSATVWGGPVVHFDRLVGPTADAGPDLIVRPGDSVSIDGTAIDPDGTIQSLSWTQLSGPTVSLSGESSRSVSFTAPNEEGTVVLRFTARDDSGLSHSDDVSISIVSIGIELESAFITVTEGGPPVSIRARLTAQPSGTVKITASESDADISLGSFTSADFTTSNWDQYQSITQVSAVDDSDVDNDSAIVDLTASGSGVSSTAQVIVTILDDDTLLPEIQFDSSSIFLDEGSTTTLRIRLSRAPSASARIRWTEVTDLGLTVNNQDSGFIDFSTINWNTYQSVTVGASDDNLFSGDRTLQLEFTLSINNAFVETRSVSVRVREDEIPVPNSPRNIAVSYSGSGPYTVSMTWDAPANASRAQVTHYLVQRRNVTDNADWAPDPARQVTGTSTTFTVSNPDNYGDRSSYRVAAVGPAGQGPWRGITNNIPEP